LTIHSVGKKQILRIAGPMNLPLPGAKITHDASIAMQKRIRAAIEKRGGRKSDLRIMAFQNRPWYIIACSQISNHRPRNHSHAEQKQPENPEEKPRHIQRFRQWLNRPYGQEPRHPRCRNPHSPKAFQTTAQLH
jgi:hypothetical protein